MPPQIIAVTRSGATQSSSLGKHKPTLTAPGVRARAWWACPASSPQLRVQSWGRIGTPLAHVLWAPLPSSGTFPVKTNSWGRGRRWPSRAPRKPGQQTPNTQVGPLPAPTATQFAHPGQGLQATGCPLPEPRWWEAARGAVAGTDPGGCKQRPSGPDPGASRARSPRPLQHPPWPPGARVPLPRGTAVRGQTR